MRMTEIRFDPEEMDVLRSVITSKTAVRDARRWLSPMRFRFAENRAIFLAAGAVADRNGSVTAGTVKAELEGNRFTRGLVDDEYLETLFARRPNGKLFVIHRSKTRRHPMREVECDDPNVETMSNLAARALEMAILLSRLVDAAWSQDHRSKTRWPSNEDEIARIVEEARAVLPTPERLATLCNHLPFDDVAHVTSVEADEDLPFDAPFGEDARSASATVIPLNVKSAA